MNSEDVKVTGLVGANGGLEMVQQAVDGVSFLTWVQIVVGILTAIYVGLKIYRVYREIRAKKFEDKDNE